MYIRITNAGVLLTNYFIQPDVALSAFVDNYILCTSGEDMVSFNSYWPASNETSLVFYLRDQPQHYGADAKNASLQDKQHCIIGLLTRRNGIVSFQGRYHTFIIHFKANGFNKIFHFPANELTDKIYYTADVLGKHASLLQEQLQHAPDVQQMACIADQFLLSFLNNHTRNDFSPDGISAISNMLYNQPNPLTIRQYAYKANMSIRNFQRRFTEQVGIPPKLYLKLMRFNEVIKLKIMQPELSWAAIACSCAYFDQTHLIKDFKRFTGFTPVDFFKNPDLKRPRIDVAEPDENTFRQFNNKLPEERFVFVKRESV